MNRRTFIHKTAASATTIGVAQAIWSGLNPGQNSHAAEAGGQAVQSSSPTRWPIGCFNRAWTKWSYDEALDGMRDAGYKLTGLLSGHRGEAFTSTRATPDYLANLKRRIAQRGLAVNLTVLQFKAEAPVEDNMTAVRQQIENAARLEMQFMMTFGVDQPAHYDSFYRLVSDAAAQGEKRGIQIVMKPHGGASGASEEIQRCLQKVGHANFRIWYDAGNIIYYTGKDPVAELKPIAGSVTGFCAKDCPGVKGEVMSQFGTGKVDFKGVFTVLKAAGFRGPIMVEGVKVGGSAAETTGYARANREFLEKVLSQV